MYEVFSIPGDILTERLEEVISDKDVATIASNLTDWESLGPYLGLSHQQVVDIRNTFREHGRQKSECLQKWKETKRNEATYEALITAAEKAEEQLLADRVKASARASST